MKKKQKDLIRYLSKESSYRFVTSQELATFLKISTRSVKNYIRDINELYDKNIIISSRNGYKLNLKKLPQAMIYSDDENIPQTNEERAFYIIKELILSKKSEIELFDLCDFLCISYSTVKSLIFKMNKNYSSYNIKFTCKNDCVYVEGTEKAKRQLIGYVINEELHAKSTNIKVLSEKFPNIAVEYLQEIIIKLVKKNNLYLNDFSLINVLVHLLIIIDRELNGNQLKSGESKIDFDTELEKNFILDLQNQIEEMFNISLNRYEVFEIYMLFKANIGFALISSQEKLKNIVGDEAVDLVEEYVSKINSLYMIDLKNDTFKLPFMLHLKNLIFRAKNNRSTTNPMADTIKYSSPIIFDIAIYIAVDLMDRFKVIINEDEIAFLAMHIGAEVERQAANKYKLPVVVICPNYYDISNQLINTLMVNFGNQINILECLSNEDDLQKFSNHVSIIFSTIPIKNNYKNAEILYLSPINLYSQFETIQTSISRNMDTQKNTSLKLEFHNYFEKDLLVLNKNLKESNEVIHYMCNILKNKNYVEDDFEYNVQRREEAAATSFRNIAIPHSVKMDAIKTSITVGIFKEGILWDNDKVYVVLLLAINKADRHEFRALYEAITMLFSEEDVIQQIRHCNTFEEFKGIIYSRI